MQRLALQTVFSLRLCINHPSLAGIVRYQVHGLLPNLDYPQIKLKHRGGKLLARYTVSMDSFPQALGQLCKQPWNNTCSNFLYTFGNVFLFYLGALGMTRQVSHQSSRGEFRQSECLKVCDNTIDCNSYPIFFKQTGSAGFFNHLTFYCNL